MLYGRIVLCASYDALEIRGRDHAVNMLGSVVHASCRSIDKASRPLSAITTVDPHVSLA
jgi:hypothetical protein